MPFLQTYVAIAIVVAISLVIVVLVKAVAKAWNSEPALATATPAGSSELAWWIEVITSQPRCTYYFGPFERAKEAEMAQAGYIEDLEQEGAQGITVKIKWGQPEELTLTEQQERQKNGKRNDFGLLSNFGLLSTKG
ncbi:Hypothetical protein, Slr0957 homolog [uncultured Synechococcales cyanobacterium]|uniref:Uncharacterized protein n=1 Tax=uncultured Synechococcales cyanobacterium TaxID=1936017 RepID=A0A6J4VUM0_9CYAN|nr:Hypothetical protein, Slr0957 homolog [uncultured Synechococcales cyanobacterium]